MINPFPHIAHFFRFIFGWIAGSLRFALSMSASQIRALMCWGMLLGVAVEGLTVIFLIFISRRFDPALIKTVIIYSEWTRLLMVFGVLFIAVQANTINARLGEKFRIDLTTGTVRPKEEGE